MTEIRINETDVRGALEMAVAYRIVETKGVSIEDARNMVRSVAVYGASSNHISTVMDAASDLFRPVLVHAMPILRDISRAVTIQVQNQLDRGQSAEKIVKGE